MRIIAFILSIFILTSSILPCMDGLVDHGHQEMELVKDLDHQHDSHDHCSPFCVCACCGISITIPSIKSLSTEKNIYLKKHSYHYAFSYHFSLLSKVWHPPTIV